MKEKSLNFLLICSGSSTSWPFGFVIFVSIFVYYNFSFFIWFKSIICNCLNKNSVFEKFLRCSCQYLRSYINYVWMFFIFQEDQETSIVSNLICDTFIEVIWHIFFSIDLSFNIFLLKLFNSFLHLQLLYCYDKN